MGEFIKGHTPWNKGLKGFMAGHTHGYQKGNLPISTTLPKGTVTNNYKHGKLEQVLINIDWKGNRKSHNVYAWYVWEVVHQQDRPKGYVIYHLDGDKENNSIDNLMPITRSQLVRINKNTNSYVQMAMNNDTIHI